MGVTQNSKNQALLMTYSNNVQDKWKHKGKDHKATYSKPKENQRSFDGASSSKKKKKLKKTKCPYYMRGFHPKSQCMKKTIDQISTLLEKFNIFLPQGANKSNFGQPT